MSERRATGKRRSQVAAAVVLLMTLLAFALRTGGLRAQSLWRDEVDALCYAFGFPALLEQALVDPAEKEWTTPCACPQPPLPPQEQVESRLLRLARVVRPMIQQNGPLYFFLLRGWIALTGSSELALRFFSTVFGVLGVPLTYVLGRRLLGQATGVLAAVLTAASPYLVWYGQEVKMYTLLPVLALLAVYALQQAMDKDGRWWIVQVVATSLALYTHIWSALLVGVQVTMLLAWWPRWRPRWWQALVSMALLTLPYLPLALWQIPAAFVVRETGFPRYGLGQMVLTLVNGWSSGIVGEGEAWAMTTCAVLALVGLVDGAIPVCARTVAQFKRRIPAGAETTGGAQRAGDEWRATIGLLGWLVIPLLGIWFISLWQPLFTDRYLIWTAPAFYLLIGNGLARLWRYSWLPASLLLGAVLFIMTGNLLVQAITPIKSDVRGAAAAVEENYQPGDLLVFQIPHLRYTFDYYFAPTDYRWADGIYTNHRAEDGSYLLTEEEVGQQMAHAAADAPVVWLVASEVSMWDERNLVQGWLEEHGQRENEIALTRVDVYRYRMASSGP